MQMFPVFQWSVFRSSLYLFIFSEDSRKYIVAAFPSACGKTNLAMLKPALEGYDITCEGDDIAWMRFDSDGYLRAINPGKFLKPSSECNLH